LLVLLLWNDVLYQDVDFVFYFLTFVIDDNGCFGNNITNCICCNCFVLQLWKSI